MVAVDGSEQAENALAKAIEVAKIHKSSLKIINIVEVHAGPYTHSVLSAHQLGQNEEESDKDVEQKQMLFIQAQMILHLLLLIKKEFLWLYPILLCVLMVK